MTDLAPVPAPPAGGARAGVVVDGSRPSSLRLVMAQARYALKLFLRRPIAAVFTVIFPVTFLVVLGSVIGNEVIDERQGIRVAQFLAPVFGVFGASMASFSVLPIEVAVARETRVLQRFSGTPVQPWMQLAGRVLTAVVESLLAVAVLLAVGVSLYGVQIVWEKVPALLVSLVLGIACMAALGLAVVAGVHSSTAVRAVTMGVLMTLSFISDIFAFGTLPTWLDRLAWFFPLRHFANAVADDLNPYLPGAGFDGGHLAVMAAWAVGGAVVAVRYFSWDPRPRSPARAGARGRPASRDATDAGQRARLASRDATEAGPRTVGRPKAGRLMLDQVIATNRQLWRDRTGFFFATAFPAVLLLFFSKMNPDARWQGLPIAAYITPVFTVYGIAVTAYVTLPQIVCKARTSGALKRLRGTPLPAWAYLGGRIGSSLVVSAFTAVLMFGIGVGLLGVRVPVVGVLWLVVALAAATACFTALGLVLAFTATSTETTAAVSLGTLLPLTFVSDVFVIGADLPSVMSAIGWFFPLRHLASMAATAARTSGGVTAAWWGHLAVVLVWTAVAAVVARWLYRRELTR